MKLKVLLIMLILNEAAMMETLAFTVRVVSSSYCSLTHHGQQHFSNSSSRMDNKKKTRTSSKSSSALNVINTNNQNPRGIDRVSVCMGELCKCQEESSELILQDLLSRNLPYVVEDAPCLGACGIGAMVSIEYQDGGYDLVTGRQETFQAVGIDIVDKNYCSNDSSSNDEDGMVGADASNGPDANANANAFSAEVVSNANVLLEEEYIDKEAFAQSITSLQGNVIAHTQSSSKEISQATRTDISDSDESDTSAAVGDDHGAVKRMRDAAKSSNDEIANPWINMALYLVNKAKDGILK